jgi:ferredoxin
MPIELKVQGLASRKEVASFAFAQASDIPHLSLMDFLRDNKIPIASSCFGEGVCRRCKVNDGLLTCQVSVYEYLIDHAQGANCSTLTVDYL